MMTWLMSWFPFTAAWRRDSAAVSAPAVTLPPAADLAPAGGPLLMPDAAPEPTTATPPPVPGQQFANSFDTWLLANNYDGPALSPLQREHLNLAWKAEIKAADDERVRRVRMIVAHFERQLGTRFESDDLGAFAPMAEVAIALGWSPEVVFSKCEAIVAREGRAS